MFAVVVRESGDAARIDQSAGLVQEQVAPLVSAARGFVSALWMSNGLGGTLNVLVFESEEAARAVLEAARTSPRPPWMKVDGADVYSVLASA